MAFQKVLHLHFDQQPPQLVRDYRFRPLAIPTRLRCGTDTCQMETAENNARKVAQLAPLE